MVHTIADDFAAEVAQLCATEVTRPTVEHGSWTRYVPRRRRRRASR